MTFGLAGHQVTLGGNRARHENAAKLTRVQKEQFKEALNKPPARSGIREEFWDARPCVTW